MEAAGAAHQAQMEAMSRSHKEDLKNAKREQEARQAAEAQRMHNLQQANHKEMMKIFVDLQKSNQDQMFQFTHESNRRHEATLKAMADSNAAMVALANRPPAVIHAGGGCCFPGTARALMEDGSTKLMNEIRIGDKVGSVDGKGNLVFSDVYMCYGHDRPARMLNLTFKTSDHETGVLKLTDEHLLYLLPDNDINRDLFFAKESNQWTFSTVSAFKAGVGDYLYYWSSEKKALQLAEIVSISATVEKGQYTILVMNNCLLVDGALASCFEVNHKMQLVDSLPLQALYKVFPSLLNKMVELVRGYDAKVDSMIGRMLPHVRSWIG